MKKENSYIWISLIVLGILQFSLLGLEYHRTQIVYNNSVQSQITIEEQEQTIAKLKDEIKKLESQVEAEKESEKQYLGKFELTFYSKEQFPNSKTATGVWPTVGRTIAVDPSVIPQGTAVEIDGFGVRYAEDTGGAIKGNKIDIFVETTAEALRLGRQKNVDVWVVE